MATPSSKVGLARFWKNEVIMWSSHSTLILAAATGLLACLLGPSLGKPSAPDPDRSLKDLQKERVEVITERVAIARKAAKAGAGFADEVRFWEERLAIATAEMEGKTADLRKIYERRLEAIRVAEQAAEKLHKAGSGSFAEVLEARDVRLETEIALARLK
jgi:hypothetical protein